MRMLVGEVLPEAGYGAIEAETGVEGLRLLRSNARSDLVVTDIGLPGGMNGRQMVDAARPARPGLKALFITGYGENTVIAPQSCGGFCGILVSHYAEQPLCVSHR
jgi:CheY-like chemotaxis protein